MSINEGNKKWIGTQVNKDGSYLDRYEEDYVPSNSNPDLEPVASHSCTAGNSIEQGGYYYDLFKFFSDNHELTLVDSEIEDIIRAVNKFRDDKHCEAQSEADMELEEDDEWGFPDETCPACGYDSGEHMIGCPEDDSPYARLCRDGYD